MLQRAQHDVSGLNGQKNTGYGRPPGLPAGTVPLGVPVPGDGALAGALMGLGTGATGGRRVLSAGWAVAGRRPE